MGKKYWLHLLIVIIVLAPTILLRYAWYRSVQENYQFLGQGMPPGPTPPGSGGSSGGGGGPGGSTDPNQYGSGSANPTAGLTQGDDGVWKNPEGTVYVWYPGTEKTLTLTLNPVDKTAAFALSSPEIDLRSLLPFSYTTTGGQQKSVLGYSPLDRADPPVITVIAPDGKSYTLASVSIWDNRHKRLDSRDSTGSNLHSWSRYVLIGLPFIVGNDPSATNFETGVSFADAIERLNDPNRCDAGLTPSPLIRAGGSAIPRDVRLTYSFNDSIQANEVRDGEIVEQTLTKNDPITANKIKNCTRALVLLLQQPPAVSSSPIPGQISAAPVSSPAPLLTGEKESKQEGKKKSYVIPQALRVVAKKVTSLVRPLAAMLAGKGHTVISRTTVSDTELGVQKLVKVGGEELVASRLYPGAFPRSIRGLYTNVNALSNQEGERLIVMGGPQGQVIAVLLSAGVTEPAFPPNTDYRLALVVKAAVAAITNENGEGFALSDRDLFRRKFKSTSVFNEELLGSRRMGTPAALKIPQPDVLYVAGDAGGGLIVVQCPRGSAFDVGAFRFKPC